MILSANAQWHRKYTSLVAWATAGLIAVTIAASAATVPKAAADKGTGQSGRPKLVDVGALPRISADEMSRQTKMLPMLTGRTKAEWTNAKAQAAAIRFVAPTPNFKGTVKPSLTPSPPNSVKTPGSSAAIVGAHESTCGNVTPADQAVAVGDGVAGVLHVINVCYEVFTQSGTLKAGFPKSLTSLVGLPAGTPVSDPRAIYDWQNHRYIVTFIQFDPNYASRSSYWIAVSSGDDPTGTFCTYNLGVQSVAASGGVFPLPDFPRLGQDRQAVYLASNIFNTNYNQEEILILPKTLMYSCSSFNFSFFNNLTLGGVRTDTTQPANFYNPQDVAKSEILVTSKNINFSCPCNGLVVWSIHSPLSSPVLTGVLVPTTNNYSLPPAASQPGSANSVDAGDARISGMAMASSGSIYASLNTNGGGGQPAYLLYQVQPFLDANGNITSGRVLNEIFHGGGSSSFFYATQQPTPEGDVTTVFNFSDASHYVGLAYASRRVSQTPGTEPDSGVFLETGAAAYSQQRWGDYTAVAPLLTSVVPSTFFAGMFAASDGTWGTAIGKNAYTNPTQ